MELRCTVTDTGIGISPAQLAKLFRSFSQVQHVSGEFGGTGLGLVISKRLIEAMQGDIEVKSDIGKGSSFSFHIFADVSAALSHPSQTSAGDTPRPLPPELSATDLHGLTVSEAAQLSRLRLIHISHPTPLISAWWRVCDFYKIETHICSTVEEARSLVQTQAAQDKDSSTLASQRRTTIVIASLDSEGVTEEACMDRLCSTLRLLRILFTNSHEKDSHARVDSALATSSPVPILAPAASSSSASASSLTVPTASPNSGSPRTPLSPSFVNRARPATISRRPSAGAVLSPLSPSSPSIAPANDSLSPSPPRVTQSGGLSPRLPAIGTLTLGRPALPSTAAGASGLVVLPPTHSRSLSDASPGTHSSRTAALRKRLAAVSEAAVVMSLDPAAVQPYPVIRRCMRKPIKIEMLLRTLLCLMSELSPIAASSPCEASPISSGPLSALSEDASGGSTPFAASSPTSLSSPIGASVSAPADAVQRSSVRPSRIVHIASKHPLRILLAEDNAINVKLMVMLLRKLGYAEILVAANGVEALEILEREAARGPSHELQVILMDASMDVMDGIECTRRIREQQLTSRIRPFIIAQTANVTEEYQRRCLDSGMDYFLPKPVHVEDLVRALTGAFVAHQAAPIGSANAAASSSSDLTAAASPDAAAAATSASSPSSSSLPLALTPLT